MHGLVVRPLKLPRTSTLPAFLHTIRIAEVLAMDRKSQRRLYLGAASPSLSRWGPAYPITQLWSSFFLGWLIKTLIMKYGSSESCNQFRPFMIGLILGNLAAMVFWMLIGFRSGVQSSYWPALTYYHKSRAT